MAALALALAMAPAWAADEEPVEIVVGMHVDVAADGRVTAVVPEDGLLPALHDSLIRHAMQWRYTPATWLGEPVAVRQWTGLKIEPVATTDGGYAIRILGTGIKHEPGTSMAAPQFPVAALRAGVNASLVYRVHLQEDGAMSPMELLQPEVAKGHVKSLDLAARAAISTYRVAPVTANGVPIACDRRFPIGFFTTAPSGLPKIDGLSPLDNQCPEAKLETAIAGTML